MHATSVVVQSKEGAMYSCFKSCVLKLRILNGLRARFAELRILWELTVAEWRKGLRNLAGREGPHPLPLFL
jgi:hypothetical protein